jgi:hypothetical protein
MYTNTDETSVVVNAPYPGSDYACESEDKAYPNQRRKKEKKY